MILPHLKCFAAQTSEILTSES